MDSEENENETLYEKVVEGKSKVVRVALVKFKGKLGIDVREMYKDDDDELKPGRKGIRIPVASGEAVLNAMTEAMAMAAAQDA